MSATSKTPRTDGKNDGVWTMSDYFYSLSMGVVDEPDVYHGDYYPGMRLIEDEENQ